MIYFTSTSTKLLLSDVLYKGILVLIGRTISHYKILRKLGEGGMGEVYLAEDIRLKRQVAIKFLPEHLTKDKQNVKRFEREAEAAASLNHPNIVTIYDIIDSDNQICIVMEFVDGKSLRDMITRNQIGIIDSIDIIKQICEGLAKAHQAGIVHRDIKPDNILIGNDGRVKILDFGLAKLRGVSKLTAETSTVGTTHYMSPEQLQGKEVDQRSDIWSLGIVMYEMITGEPPFRGEYESVVTYSILNDEPKLVENIPPELQIIIKKALNKNSEQRFQNCKEMLGELDSRKSEKPKKGKFFTKRSFIYFTTVVVFSLTMILVLILFPVKQDEDRVKSLAVLPFTNIKPDPNTDYLGLAFAAEIISDMSYFKNITIIPFSSVREISDKRKLKVDYILTGNFIRLEDEISLKIEFFESETEKIIWQESLNRPYEESHNLLSDVSKKVIDGLKINFSSDERMRMEKDIPKNSLAYDYYLRSFAYPLTINGSSDAIRMLDKSIQLDSTYAPALVELGYHISRLAQHAYNKSDDIKIAEQYFLNALKINGDLIDALVQLAGLYTEIGKSEEAYALALKALKVNPNNAWVHYRLSYIYRYTGMLEESAREVEKTLLIDNQNPRFGAMQMTYYLQGNYRKVLEISKYYKENVFTKQRIGQIYYILGQIDSALIYSNRALEDDPDSMPGTLAWVLKEFIENNPEEGYRVLNRWEKTDPYDSELIFLMARLYCLLGYNEDGIRLIRKAVHTGFYCYSFFLIDPFLDPVRDDPEFQEISALAKQKHELFKQKYFAEVE